MKKNYTLTPGYIHPGKNLPWWKYWCLRVPPYYAEIVTGPVWVILPMRIYYAVKMFFRWIWFKRPWGPKIGKMYGHGMLGTKGIQIVQYKDDPNWPKEFVYIGKRGDDRDP